ncbi:MAG: FMN-binding protein [Clostridiales bacterium]|nr:FMN-binding protein [Clostridiales bacterium]
MRDIIKLAVRLFVFSLVAAVLLALTYEVTKGPIAEQKIAAQKEALNKVLPGCANYEEIEAIEGLAEGSAVEQLFAGKNDAGDVQGYALVANPQGYGGPIPITLGVSTEGYVTQTYVGALQETAGLGSRVGEAEFMDQFIGIAADPDTLRDDVDTIGGATISSSAFINAVSDMLTYTRDTLGIEPHAGDKDAILAAAAAANGGETAEAEPIVTTGTYDVTGFAPFKVEIAVDENGKIVSVSVPEHSETPGFGADLIADTAVFDALVGQDIATAQIDVKAGATLTSNAINDALRQAGTPAESAAKTYDVTGFAPFKVAIELDDAGKIVSVSVPENGETPGFGADLIADTAVFDALVGQDIATAQIDVKSGVTLTSNAINDALRQAAAEFGGANDAAPVIPGDPYTVKGMNKFTLYIEVEDGKIVSVSAPNHNETPGLGADLLTEDALAALAGQDLATAQVDVKSGVTLTSDAINDALHQAAAANGIEIAEETEEETAPVEAPAENASASDATAYEVTGFQPFKVEIAVDEAGKIVSVSVPENSETPGFGADLIADTAVFDALVGQDIATAQIDVKSGVTLTSNAINDALRQAAAAAAPAEEAEPAADAAAAEAKAYEVTGFQPFKVEIAVDEAGKIVSVSVPENSETPGFGADLIADTAVFDALVGQDIATAQIDVKSGVTLTSNAINDALRQAAAAAAPAGEVTGAPAAQGNATVYEVQVMGINSKHPFTLDISVDETGVIVGATCPEHSETEGKGATMLTDEALSVLIGQSISDAKVDIKSGVTVTSNAINNALAIIAAHVD